MARAARLAPATSSEASSTVMPGSWLMTDITMLIMVCRRRILRNSSSSASLNCGWEGSGLALAMRGFLNLVRPARALRTNSFAWSSSVFDEAACADVAPFPSAEMAYGYGCGEPHCAGPGRLLLRWLAASYPG